MNDSTARSYEWNYVVSKDETPWRECYVSYVNMEEDDEKEVTVIFKLKLKELEVFIKNLRQSIQLMQELNDKKREIEELKLKLKKVKKENG